MTFNPSKLKYEFKDFVGIYENAFTAKECEDTIKLFEKYHEKGYTYNRLVEGKNTLSIKNDTALSMVPRIELDWDPDLIEPFHTRFYDYIYPLYNLKYPILQTLQKHRSRHIKLQKTFPSQGYHIWHCEHEPTHKDRILSWILYLNDIEEGGETEFLYQSLRIKPKTGTFILFPAHFTHTHRGNPPLSGVKYIATGWIEFSYTSERQGASEPPDLTESKKSIFYQ